jgi:uncharacterized protein YjbI with pentapeptide repeats
MVQSWSEEGLENLKKGGKAWRKWRSDNFDQDDEELFTLGGRRYFATFSSISLDNLDFQYAKLTYLLLSNLHTKHVNFTNGDFKDTTFQDAYLYKSNFSETNFRNTDLTSVTFIENKLNQANFSKTTTKDVRFFGSDLTGVDFSGADLREALFENSKLTGANFTDANLSGARFVGTDLKNAVFTGANLSYVWFKEHDNQYIRKYKLNLAGINIRKANLSYTNLKGVNLSGLDFTETNLTGTVLREANLSDCILDHVKLIDTNLVQAKVDNAQLSNSEVYGVNVWDLKGDFKEQRELIITPDNNTSAITVDNIKVAQFVYLILNNKEIRDVLNTLTSKTVLILGRFALPERKVILDALRNRLREYDLLPIVFDFERPDDKDFTETIKTLAGMCYFVIADVTNPKSSPLELQATVPDYQIPFVPIIQEGENPFAMMVDLQKKYDWVLDTISYKDSDQLIRILKKGIIDRAMQKHNELRLIKMQMPTVISASQFEE